MADLYNGQRTAREHLFPWAIELLAAVVATPRGSDVRSTNPRYGIRVTQPSRCVHHATFWKSVTSVSQHLTAITTNYDLLIERCLRHKPMKRAFGPGFYYGGLKRPQVLKGSALPFTVTDPQRFVELTGSIPIFKLHGSLSWSWSGGMLELYQDLRPAFRRGGDAAIVPPVSQKQVPEWLKPIWDEAELGLSQADCWIVCGYSLPQYDSAILEMLRRASRSRLQEVFILDPDSVALRDKLSRIAPTAQIHSLAGLPEGTEELCERATNSLTCPFTGHPAVHGTADGGDARACKAMNQAKEDLKPK